MKRNFSLLLAVVLVSLLLIYLLSGILNDLFFDQRGGGFDVGLDDAMVDILIGILSIPFLLSPVFFGVWGIGKWKWAIPVVICFVLAFGLRWVGSYLWISGVLFIFGIVLAQIINFLRRRIT